MEQSVIEFLKETGMALLWLFIGYLVGEKSGRKDE